jgi:hypothetical protein
MIVISDEDERMISLLEQPPRPRTNGIGTFVGCQGNRDMVFLPPHLHTLSVTHWSWTCHAVRFDVLTSSRQPRGFANLKKDTPYYVCISITRAPHDRALVFQPILFQPEELSLANSTSSRSGDRRPCTRTQ